MRKCKWRSDTFYSDYVLARASLRTRLAVSVCHYEILFFSSNTSEACAVHDGTMPEAAVTVPESYYVRVTALERSQSRLRGP